MENRAHALAAGLFLLLLGIAAAGGMWWFSQAREAMRELVLVSKRSVTGLNPQAPVRYRGMRVGQVTDIDLDPNDRRSILVTVKIPEDIPITGSTTAQLVTQGLTGVAYVQIDDTGESNELLRGAPRIPLKPSNLEQLGDAAQEMLGEARQLVARVRLLLDDANVARIARTLAQLEQASGRLNESLEQLPPVIAGAREAVSAENLKKIENTLAYLERAGAQAPPLMADARSLVASLQAMSASLERLSTEAGAEVVGKTLPRLNDLVDELTLTSRQVKRLADQLEGAPQSLIFGRRRPAPGPGEAGFNARVP